MTGGFSRHFQREVGATPEEFCRALKLAHPDLREEAGVLCVDAGEVRLRVRLVRGESRRLGLFILPVLHASYAFEAGSDQACRALLARLDLAMQRGGG